MTEAKILRLALDGGDQICTESQDNGPDGPGLEQERNTTMKHTLVTAAVGALALALAGCGAGDPSATATVVVTKTVTVTAEPVGAPAEEVEPTPPAETPKEDAEAPTASGMAAFGETVTLPNNEGTITISEPQPYTPSGTAFLSGEWDEFVVMDVTEVNDSDEPVNAGWVFRATSGNQEAERVHDSAQGVTSPMVEVMPGKSIEYKIAFGRMAGEDFVLTASPFLADGKVRYQQ